ncbi:MAG: Lrp/AsnC ligand binding domain-containing protein [Candidatus Methanomethylicaceae archaeon]
MTSKLQRKLMRAFVLVRTKPGTSEEVVKSRRIKGVKIANSVLGRVDVILVIEAYTLEEIRNILYEMVEKNPNVVRTETLISITPEAEEE